MRDGGHLRITLALASLAHLGAFAGVHLAPRSPARPPVAAISAMGDLDATFFEIQREEPPVPQDSERAVAPAAPDAPRVPGSAALANVRATASAGTAGGMPGAARAAGDGTAASVPQDVPPSVVTSPNGEGWSFHWTAVDLGLDPRKRRLFAAGPAPSAADAPRGPGAGAVGAPHASTTGGLKESLDAADVARGLGRGGVVSTAIHDAVQASSVMGTAIFAVTIDGAGAISVRVSSASQDELGWARLNESIRASVAARKDQIRMPAGAQGLRIAVQAEAKEQFPNGVKPKDLGTKGVAKGPSVTETKDKVDLHLPELGVVHHGKVCSVGVSVIPPFIAGGCDPSNIGTVAQRIVTSRVVSESRL